MNTELLKYFLTVVRFMNITKAAEYLYMTQPTLSKKIIALENELGAELFIRKGRRLELTEAGSLVYEEGGEISGRITALEEKLHRLRVGVSGHLNIEGEPAYHQDLFRLYRDFRIQYPEIHLTIRHSHFDAAIEKLYAGTADIGIIRSFELTKPQLREKFHIFPVYDDESCLCVAEHHPLAGCHCVTLDQLSGEKFICLSHMEQANYFQRYAKKAHSTMTYTLAENFNDMMQEIRSGGAIGMVEKGLPPDNYIGCKLLDVQNEVTKHSIVMLWDKKNTNPALQYFVESLHSYFPNN